MASHPDSAFVNYVLDGIKHGFHLGFEPTSTSLSSAENNMQSALNHPHVIDEYLANEFALGRMAGPFQCPPLHNLHVSRFGVLPKKGQPGKWRLIVDLSHPKGLSVNDAIDSTKFRCITLRSMI